MNFQPLLCCILLLLAEVAYATPFETADLSMDIPSGFEGSVTVNKAGGTVSAFTKRQGSSITLLEIASHDFGAQRPSVPQSQLGDLADHYNAEFLKSIEARRSAFMVGPTTRLLLDGIPSSRMAWVGIFDGKAASGVIYCTVFGSKVFSFHAQELKGGSSAGIPQASKSIESVKFNHAGR